MADLDRSAAALERIAVALEQIALHLIDSPQSGAGVTPPAPAAAAFAAQQPRQSTVDLTTCPIHDVPWKGEPGDLFHKTPEGKWCRHPDNVRKAR